MAPTRRVVLAAALTFATFPAAAQTRIETIEVDEVKRGLADGSIDLVDVREPDEWAAGHVEGARLLPLSQFDPSKLPQAKEGRKIVVMCRSGSRSQRAIAAAQAAGRSDVKLNFAGGILAWQSSGGAVAR